MINSGRLSLGTAQFGLNYGLSKLTNRMSISEAKKIIDYAQLNGINSLDTAIAYGDSEERLGKIGIHKWDVVSKLPTIGQECENIPKLVMALVKQSIGRLGINRLYGVLLHQPSQLLEKNGEEIYQALLAVKKSGLVKKIGISIYEPAELDIFLNRFQFDLVQAPLNILDNRIVDSGWMTHLPSLDIELQVRSAFLQGLLLMDRHNRPAKFDRWKKILANWDDWLSGNNLTPISACLNFTLSFQQVSKVIIGVDNVSQLNEIISLTNEANINIPNNLKTTDCNLLNPFNWQ